jgi:hypothetical protein
MVRGSLRRQAAQLNREKARLVAQDELASGPPLAHEIGGAEGAEQWKSRAQSRWPLCSASPSRFRTTSGTSAEGRPTDTPGSPAGSRGVIRISVRTWEDLVRLDLAQMMRGELVTDPVRHSDSRPSTGALAGAARPPSRACGGARSGRSRRGRTSYRATTRAIHSVMRFL